MPDKEINEKDSAGKAHNGVDGVVKPPAADGLGGDLNSRYDVGKKFYRPRFFSRETSSLAPYPPCGTRLRDALRICPTALH